MAGIAIKENNKPIFYSVQLDGLHTFTARTRGGGTFLLRKLYLGFIEAVYFDVAKHI